jgi:hypothetical protein
MKGNFSNKIIMPLFIVIVLIALFLLTLFLINNSSLSRDTGYDSGDLELNEVLIKILLKEGESLEKSIQVTNVGGAAELVVVTIEDLEGILFLEDNEFELRPGETKNLDLSFISGSDTFTFEPGVYLGNLKFQYSTEEVILPIVVEIESEEVLFDMNLDFSVNDRVVLVGGTALADVTVYNFGELDSATVDMKYIVSNMDNVRLLSEEDNIVVQTQALITKTISIPDNFNEGKYVFYVLAEYGDSVGTASYIFDVSGESPGNNIGINTICSSSDPLCWVSFVILIILIFFVGAYIFVYLSSFLSHCKKKDRSKKDLKLKIEKQREIDFKRQLELEKARRPSFWGGLFGNKESVKKKVVNKKQIVKKKKFRFMSLFFKKTSRKSIKKPGVKKKVIKKKQIVKKKKFRFMSLFFKKSTKRPIKNIQAKGKPTFLGRWAKDIQKKKKEREQVKRKTALERKEEKKRIEFERKKKEKRDRLELKRQELKAKKEAEKEKKKAELEEKKWKKEQKKMMNEAHKLETKFKAKKFKARVEKQKAVMPRPRLVAVETINPSEKIDQLVHNCKVQIGRHNFSMAESFYEQIKPIYAKLETKEKKNYYPMLMEMQSNIAMLQMSEMRKSLLPKKK